MKQIEEGRIRKIHIIAKDLIRSWVYQRDFLSGVQSLYERSTGERLEIKQCLKAVVVSH